MSTLFQSLAFNRGPVMKNRFMLAPLTNLQSQENGVLSDEEFHWLTMRASGGFGLVMTCAAHVQAVGQGFPGQLGIFSDIHLDGLTRLAAGIRRHGSLAFIQLHHAGMRSPADLIGTRPLCPSADEETGAREMSIGEVEQLADDFVAAAARAERAGFDGIEVHGAHGYIIGQFLSPTINRRKDRFGGSLENRCRLLFDLVDRVRAQSRPDFLISVRLSPERLGLELSEVIVIAQHLLESGQIDLLDMSLWDVFKQPDDEQFKGDSLLSPFTALERGAGRLAAAGKITGAREAEQVIAAGVDIVTIGRSAILHHDFPELCRSDPDFRPHGLPVSREYLRHEGLSSRFIDYMSSWEGFVADPDAQSE